MIKNFHYSQRRNNRCGPIWIRGYAQIFKELKPTEINANIIAMVSLYRTGSIPWIPCTLKVNMILHRLYISINRFERFWKRLTELPFIKSRFCKLREFRGVSVLGKPTFWHSRWVKDTKLLEQEYEKFVISAVQEKDIPETTLMFWKSYYWTVCGLWIQ